MSASPDSTLAGQILSRLGDEKAIAKALGGVVTPKAVEQWWRRGRIPAEHDFSLLRVAERLGVPLSHEELSMTRRGNGSRGT